ncbi:putative Triacylglycerol lipase [Rhodotorula taiwanensis]|uniref:60S ribosomal protein L27 n=1 Tax=Rhodotorula taiwanensis TaxID=741276 RepID=A0A2S5B2M8_9BASI|nr:putative Triacylglycerol lipase [Rhodotorula taiwanensis]
MPKIYKPGKVALVLQGRYAGRKVVVIRQSDEGTKERPYPHAIVAGIERYPRKVTKGMGKKRIEKRSKVKPFIKLKTRRDGGRASATATRRVVAEPSGRKDRLVLLAVTDGPFAYTPRLCPISRPTNSHRRLDATPDNLCTRMTSPPPRPRSRPAPQQSVNYNHLLPTRYALELESLKGVVAPETFKEVSSREDAKKQVKKAFEERYLAGKNRWFFSPLRF